MSDWTTAQRKRFYRHLHGELVALGLIQVEKAEREGLPLDTYLNASAADPGRGYRVLETPYGRAKVLREAEDGPLLVWMADYGVVVEVPADLCRPSG